MLNVVTCVENIASSLGGVWQEFLHTTEDHALNSCVKLVKTLIFTGIQRAKLGCSTKITV